jgi:hypothetical protein
MAWSADDNANRHCKPSSRAVIVNSTWNTQFKVALNLDVLNPDKISRNDLNWSRATVTVRDSPTLTKSITRRIVTAYSWMILYIINWIDGLQFVVCFDLLVLAWADVRMFHFHWEYRADVPWHAVDWWNIWWLDFVASPVRGRGVCMAHNLHTSTPTGRTCTRCIGLVLYSVLHTRPRSYIDISVR